MSKKLFDISEKIDSHFVEIFQAIDGVIQKQGIKYFVIGATARDIILKYCYGITRNYRATQDIDIGIHISDWDEFESLKKALLKYDSFVEDREKIHRVHYKKTIPIDLVPFGDIGENADIISWPPNHETEMSVLGFGEAYEYSQKVRSSKDPVLDINFANLEGLFIMKLVSWAELKTERRKDAVDISIILDNYEYTGKEDSLYKDEAILKQNDFDYSNAIARLLGREVAKIAKPKTIDKISQILDKELEDGSNYQLARDMVGEIRMSNRIESNIQLLKNARQGISDIAKTGND